MRFSERIGVKSVRDVIQKDDIDDALRNGLWNTLNLFYWGSIGQEEEFDYFNEYSPYNNSNPDSAFKYLFLSIWLNYFKQPIDTLPYNWKCYRHGYRTSIYDEIHRYFYSCKWYEIYDFIEFVPNNYHSDVYRDTNDRFMKYCNDILARELSAYRFVDGKLAPITSGEEINSIEEVLTSYNIFKPVELHLRRALELFSDRNNPDYRNSIKESISAVEAMCKLVVGDEKDTLAKAIKKVGWIHPALQDGFIKIYGYSSGADGIRHALMEKERLQQEDAKFMLVACSAFINYLKAKSVA
jgi:hypothetical protein